MISFIICVVLLAAAPLLYGRRIDRIFGPDGRQTPAYAKNDGVDYVPMPLWKVFLIQLLNIAGTGPIFGALSGALFGPVVYLWIVFGCIFAGGVHDYMCGMLSMRHGGADIPELTGRYLGSAMKQVMRVFSVVLLVMCGVVFTTGPAGLLDLITPKPFGNAFWLILILIYYFIASFLPIDKIIGMLYPLFGICMIIMAMGTGGSLMFSGKFDMPEIWSSFSNAHPEGLPVWPFMFITVACGAVSGFHATQSPIMARCCRTEAEGRRVFYGAMAAEGIIAMVWAAAGVSCYENSRALLEAGAGCSAVVYEICKSTMGKLGCTLAMVGVIVCPISSGDTAFRSARLIIAEWFGMDQSKAGKRLAIVIPLLAAGAYICTLNYNVVWRFFSWANQSLASITLWTAAVYMAKNRRPYLFAMIPAAFMTATCTAYFVAAPECLGGILVRAGIERYLGLAAAAGIAFALAASAVFLSYARKRSIQ